MKKREILLVAILCAVSFSSGAQDLNTGFFLDSYAFGHRINPALQCSSSSVSGYAGIGVDIVNVMARTNVAPSNFVFSLDDGTLVSGLDNRIPADEFLGGIKDNNNIILGLNENILSFGTRGKRGLSYNFEMNVKSLNNLNVSSDVFKLLKKGVSSPVVDINDFSLSSDSYVEFALGFAKRRDNFSLGFKVKALAGIASAQASLKQLKANYIDDTFSIVGTGEIKMAAAPLSIVGSDGVISTPEFAGPKDSGLGVAFDLGFCYNIGALEISAAVVDLGGITWKYDTEGTLYYDSADGEQFRVVGNESSTSFKMLPLTVNAGVRYGINRMLSAGVLGTYKYGFAGILEARAGLTFTPGSILSLAVSGGLNNFGPVCGAALNLCLGPVNLYAGIDGIIAGFTAQGVPENPLNTTASAGLLISW